MKLFRNAVLLLVVLGLLTGAYFLVKSKKTSDTAGSTENKALKMLDLGTDQLTGITLENRDGKFVFVKRDKEWVLSFPEGLKIDKSRIEALASELSGLTASKLIEEDAKDLAQYGLDKPSTVSATLSDGSLKTVELGDRTPAGDGYYVKLKGSGKVYTVDSYTGDKLNSRKNDIRDRTVFTAKAEEITGFSMDKAGKTVFAAKKEDDNWVLTLPLDANADMSSLGIIFNSVLNVTVKDFVEDNPPDSGKYGLKNPSYSIEVETAKGKTRIDLGSEKEKGSLIYGRIGTSNEVVTFDEGSLNFLDKPLKEIMEVFAYIVNISDVDKITVEMDGKTDVFDIQTDKDDKDKDRFYFNGKDISALKNDKGSQLFREYYEALIGVTMDDVEIGANPSGKADITLTYFLKKAPGTMKVEFIPKDGSYYYVMKNGKYSNIIVARKKFDETSGVRGVYKKLVEAMESKK